MDGEHYTVGQLLTHATIVLAACAMIATGLRDLFEDKTVMSGTPPQPLRVPFLESQDAEVLRATVRLSARRLFDWYAFLAILVVIVEYLLPKITISFAIGSWMFSVALDGMLVKAATLGHLMIVVYAAWLVARIIRVRESEARTRWSS